MSDGARRVSEARVAQAYQKALRNGWTEDLIEEETTKDTWETYKAIMSFLSHEEYRRIVSTGGTVRYLPTDGKGF